MNLQVLQKSMMGIVGEMPWVAGHSLLQWPQPNQWDAPASGILTNLVTDDVPSRLVKLLTRLSSLYGRQEGDTIILDIHLTHQDMADKIGASRQTVTSELHNLKRKGAIETQHHRIHIQNEQLLDEYSFQENVS